MQCRLTLLGLRFYAGVNRVTWVDGVNSKLPDGNHVLMWDFDEITLDKLIAELTAVQINHRLSNIYIVNTGRPNSYHAYCFTSLPFEQAFDIVSHTEGVCRTFVKMAFVRDYFTLRYGDKKGRELEHAGVIKSDILETVAPLDLGDYVRYLTKVK